eukprot:CAMPEP_0116846406 /NCGR_PEP_ID=MMETSP0418-20121206/13814_1 /TAXON_ID=1158023 /ORGANISM="Astrosyne radiata, Strain 13vi08-1A" /LENGTH=193 /DNA_ID=CAMNT_0004477643 /DNA_START=351 /DNA_END=929 /DNA_ORIENTATION=+
MLESSDVSGSVASEIGQLTKVAELRLLDNDLVGTIPSEIGLLTDLKSLVMIGEVINGRVPSELGLSGSLVVLSPHSTDVSGFVPEELGQLSNRTNLRLDNTLLSGSTPSICDLDADVLVDCGRVECTYRGCPPTPASSCSSEPRAVPSETSQPTYGNFRREASLKQTDECGWRGDWFYMNCNSGSGVVIFRLE